MRVAAQRLAVDDQRDLGDVGVRRAAMLLVRELDDGIGAVVEHPLEPPELALRIVADPVRDLDVLALDDRPHASPPGRRRSGIEYSPGPFRGLFAGRPRLAVGRPAVPRPARGAAHRSRATVIAETAMAPRGLERLGAGRQRRAGGHDVVDEETHRPASVPVVPVLAAAARSRNAPATLPARSSRPRSNWATVARARSSARTQGSRAPRPPRRR